MTTNQKLELGTVSLDYIEGKPYRTRVVLKNGDGAYYPVYFDKGAIDLDPVDLYEQALQKVYDTNFPQKAESEKFDKLNAFIKEYDEQLKAQAEKMLGENKASYLKSLAKTLEDVQGKVQLNIRNAKKNGKVFTEDQNIENMETLSTAVFQVTHILHALVTLTD